MRKSLKMTLVWLGLSLSCCILTAADGTSSQTPLKTVASATVVTGPSEIKTADGKIYRKVEVQRVEPDGLAIAYEPDTGGVGMAKLKFRDLPEDLRRRYAYDKEKAASFETDQLRKQAEVRTRLMAEYKDGTNRLAMRLAQEESLAASNRNAHMFINGGGPFPDPLLSEKIEVLQAKADSGDVPAQKVLAIRYYQIWETKRARDSREQALHSLRPLAESGDSDSQLHLGWILKTGEWYDVQEGVKWLRLAAGQDNRSAMHTLGVMYQRSANGVPKDIQEAIKWYRMEAEHGYTDPALGSLYEETGDAIEALKWYAIAKRYNSNANSFYDTLRNRMSPDQISEAETRANQFNVGPRAQ